MDKYSTVEMLTNRNNTTDSREIFRRFIIINVHGWSVHSEFYMNNLWVKVYCCSRHSGFWDPKGICTINHKAMIPQNQTMDQAWVRGGRGPL